MYKKLISLLLLCLTGHAVFTQVPYTGNAKNDTCPAFIKPLSPLDSLRLMQVPELQVPPLYKSVNAPVLPASVDNSTKSHFRPITSQSGYECGQTAGIAFVFTYEINRLRNFASNSPAHQYATHFSWNFLNDAYNYKGVSFFDTWEITRLCGNPNVLEYGGTLDYGGEKRWMSGYTEYYSSMKNRISGVYGIRCDSPEGLDILKYWFFDHLEGSNTGGIGCLYAQYCSPDATLPAGTPEAGKALISFWGPSPSHAWTICGYNDSIRYDYNNDGQYTNDVDINGDGIVDMKDWEIGGLKLCNNLVGPSWGNSGFAYMMYKSLADNIGSNGIWNHTLYVVKAKETQEPQATFKVTLKHDKRNQIKVIAGVSTQTNATKPDVRLEYPIFNFHGDALYMQGGQTEADKTIEFGLDVTPLLSGINSGQQATFFLEVIEKDTGTVGTGTGFINSFSLVDYTTGFPQQTNYPVTNVFITNNDTTCLGISHTFNFSKVNIPADSMNALVYNPYSHQLNATAGSPPYKWDFCLDYAESVTNEPFPAVTAQQLNTSSLGYAAKDLSFSFPFYGRTYNKIFIYPNGFIKFDNALYTFPYLIDSDLLFRSHRIIAPFLAILTYGAGLGIWCEEGPGAMTVRWKARISGQVTSNVNVAVKLYESGKIEFYYGAVNMTGNWLSALSGGDQVTLMYTQLSNAFTTNTTDRKITLLPPDYPAGMALSESGLFTALPVRYHNTTIKVKVTDNNNITAVRSIPFKTSGLLINYSPIAGNDTLINPGDTAKLSVKVRNISATTFSTAGLLLQSQDTLIQITDSTGSFTNLNAGDSIVLQDVFAFTVSNQIHDGHFIDMTIHVMTPQDTFSRDISLRANSYEITTGNVIFSDGNNNILEPGETAAMILEIKNTGGAAASNLNLTLTTADPYITLNPSTAYIDTLLPGTSKNAFFIITTSPAIPSYYIVVLNLAITGSNNFSYNTSVFIEIGSTMEDFETADFTKYPWSHGGNQHWLITDSVVYQGNEAARSGYITHSQTSYLSINQYILSDGYVRFFKKVSCERDNNNHNYDYLAFYIDGAEKARWDGDIDWSQESFPVTSGNHTFKWTYVKDYSVNYGLDAAWLDNISFPLCGDPNPELTVIPSSISRTVFINSTDSADLFLHNAGNGLIIYSNTLQMQGTGNTWLSCGNPAGAINAGLTQNAKLFFNTQGLSEGNYFADVKISYNIGFDTIVPVQLYVVDNTDVGEWTGGGVAFSCAPNPVQDMVYMSLTTPNNVPATIVVYNMQGQAVRHLLNDRMLPQGTHCLNWDLTNGKGLKLPPGVYLCRLTCGDTVICRKIIIAG